MFRQSLSSSRLAVRSGIFRNSQERLLRKTRLEATRGAAVRCTIAMASSRSSISEQTDRGQKYLNGPQPKLRRSELGRALIGLRSAG